MKDIKFVTSEKAGEIIETRKERGLFYTKEDDKYIAIYNTDGDAWVEEFDTKEECIEYLTE